MLGIRTEARPAARVIVSSAKPSQQIQKRKFPQRIRSPEPDPRSGEISLPPNHRFRPALLRSAFGRARKCCRRCRQHDAWRSTGGRTTQTRQRARGSGCWTSERVTAHTTSERRDRQRNQITKGVVSMDANTYIRVRSLHRHDLLLHSEVVVLVYVGVWSPNTRGSRFRGNDRGRCIKRSHEALTRASMLHAKTDEEKALGIVRPATIFLQHDIYSQRARNDATPHMT